MASEDELAHTATAPAASSPASPRPSLVGTLGRFRLETELGSGGMGVVYAAFDPELERRVALKVLRSVSEDARARLLREARAMAKLSHPHVITVYEAGTADGQDYIAMELIRGTTLGEWVQRERPAWRVVIAAFTAAAQGLAAAHKAGLVHRDFKPHNVLHSDDGRVLVTDFGLARGVERASAPEVGGGAVDYTMTGAIVGTPAYMAPEQWTADVVGPASDQFSLCVALWEALAGKRPFAGGTVEELRTATLAGPRALDDSTISRPLRSVLKRGLAVDPKDRWPDLESLIRELQRVVRRRARVMTAVGAVLVIAALVVGFTFARGGTIIAAPTCPAPGLDPAKVWSPARSQAIASRGAEAAKLLDEDFARWNEQRAKACGAPDATRSAALGCLDAVQARFAAIVESIEHDAGPVDADGLAIGLVDPVMCERTPPAAVAPTTPGLVDAFTWARRAASRTLNQPALDLSDAIAGAREPCAEAVVHVARINLITRDPTDTKVMPHLTDGLARLGELATSCPDDVLRVRALLVDTSNLEKIERGRAGAKRVSQPDLLAQAAAYDGFWNAASDNWDAAATNYERAITLFGQRHSQRQQIQTVERYLGVLSRRGRPEDLTKIIALSNQWRTVAGALDEVIGAKIARHAGMAQWRLGDVKAASTILAQIAQSKLIPLPEVQRGVELAMRAEPLVVRGTVVDSLGAPVAGAVVTSGRFLVADAAMLATPIRDDMVVTTTTDAAGSFELAAHKPSGIVAMLGDQRSVAINTAASVRLVLEPTSRLEGLIQLVAAVPTTMVVEVSLDERGRGYIGIAPVKADGTFAITGVPRGKVEIAAGTLETATGPVPLFHTKHDSRRTLTLVVDRAEHVGLVVPATEQRRLYVIGRSITEGSPEIALVMMFRGHHDLQKPTFAALIRSFMGLPQPALPVSPATSPDRYRDQLKPDDLGIMVDAPIEDLTVCGLPMSMKLLASLGGFEKLTETFMTGELGCAAVGPNDSVVTIPLPAIRRSDAPK